MSECFIQLITSIKESTNIMMGTIHKALKLRLYPNSKQQELLNKTLGSCRAIYNMMLHERKEVYEKLKDDKRKLYEYTYRTEKEYKKEYEWLQEVDSIALQQARIDLSKAYQNFFKGLKGKYKQKYNFPKFKKKRNGSSYRTVNVSNGIRIDFNNRKVKLPKVGWLNFRDKRNEINGTIKSATVRRTATGKYFVSLLIEEELYLPSKPISNELKAKTIGLDMSLEKFFVDSNGTSPAYERLYRSQEKKLAREQRKLSKKKKGSNSWYKQLQRVSKVYEKIANKRNDFTHKLSTDLTKKYEVIVAENLSLKGMAQGFKFGKSIADLGYSKFIHQLQYKSLWNNKIFLQADKYFASSKTCSICGYKNTELTLSDRTWNCPNCGTILDRDVNAGVNLKNYGLKELGLGQSELKPVESSFETSKNENSVKQEAKAL